MFFKDARTEAGKIFEKEVYEYLKMDASIFGGAVLRNLLFEHNDGTTELDIAMVTSRGVLCVECKHRDVFMYSCIEGSREDTWLCVGEGDVDTMPNPVYQNMLHINAVKKVLPGVKIINTICTSIPVKYTDGEFTGYGPSYFAKGGENEPDILFISDRTRVFEKILNMPAIYTKEQIKYITGILKQHEASSSEMRKHVKYVKSLH